MILTNKFRIGFLIIIVAMQSSCNDKQGLASIQYHKPVQLVDSRSIYEVINFCLKNQDIDWQCETLADSGLYSELPPDDLFQIAEMDTIFTKEDYNFMVHQRRYNNYFKISDKYVNKYKLVSTDTLLYMRQKSYEDKNYNYYTEKRKIYQEPLCSIDMPLFSKNKKYCLVIISNHGESGASYILKRTGKTWKIIYKYGEWVS